MEITEGPKQNGRNDKEESYNHLGSIWFSKIVSFRTSENASK